jgi:hypothetical protein
VVIGDFNFDGKSDLSGGGDKTENERNFSVAIPDYEDVWPLLHRDEEYGFCCHIFSPIQLQTIDG